MQRSCGAISIRFSLVNWRIITTNVTSTRDIDAGLGVYTEFVSTPLLARCHYIGRVLVEFHCPLKSVRLLSLALVSLFAAVCGSVEAAPRLDARNPFTDFESDIEAKKRRA
jgi:hypothetical protein